MIFCDMTSGPRGELITVEERIADILVRHEGNPTLELFIDAGDGHASPAGWVSRVRFMLPVP